MSDETSFGIAQSRFALSALPTPLERCRRFEMALESEGARCPRVYLKRDDLLSIAMGGNKIRSLEFIVGEALQRGATDIITAGRQQSNHCRLTAAACAKAGLRAHVVLNGTAPARSTGNLLLDGLFGANIYYTESEDRRVRESRIAGLVSRIQQDGGKPYVVPVGGSDAVGSLGHALLAAELSAQCREIGESLQALVLATATGGTQAGLLAGFSKMGETVLVYGFHVADADIRAIVVRLANETASLIGSRAVDEEEVVIDKSQRGKGYGIVTPAATEAIRLLARTEGVLADPVYTGKALAGLIALVRGGAFSAGQAVVFLHSGGTPALFAERAAIST